MDSFLYDNGLRHERVKEKLRYFSSGCRILETIGIAQQTIACSKSTIETLEKVVKYVQSYQ